MPPYHDHSIPRIRDSDWWLWVAPIAMLLATDFSFRLRDPNSQELDGYVFIQIVVYAVAAIGFSLVRVAPVVRRYWRIRSLWLLAFYLTATTFWSSVPLLSLAFGIQLAVIVLMTHTSSGHRPNRHFQRFLHAFVLLVLVGLASASFSTSIGQESRSSAEPRSGGCTFTPILWRPTWPSP